MRKRTKNRKRPTARWGAAGAALLAGVYLLTTKLFCGKCGTLMGGESGTSHMGNTYYYYKCGKAKRHGKAHCDLKAIRKEPLERFVVETAIKVIFSDEIIERLIDLIMEAQQQASVYGNTENAANILACRLSERGVRVQMFDTSVTPTSYILSAAFRYSHLVFAATTYNAGVFITMEELLHDIAAHNLQNRRVVLLENGSWAPASGKEMQKILQPLKGWQQMEDTFTIRSALREDQTMQLERLAATLAADVQAAAPAEEKPEGQHRYVCKVCGYVYEGDSLPEDYKCPLCGAGAEYFKQES